MERPAMRERFARLTDVYTCFRTGSCPSTTAADVARVIFSAVCGPEPSEDGECVELSCIGVTLVEKLASSLPSRSLPPAAFSYWEQVLRVLLQDMDLMPQLVSGPLSSG